MVDITETDVERPDLHSPSSCPRGHCSPKAGKKIDLKMPLPKEYIGRRKCSPGKMCLYWVLWVLWVLWLLVRGKFQFPGIIHWVTRLTIVTSLPCFELEQIRDHFSQPTWGGPRSKSGLGFALTQSIKKVLSGGGGGWGPTTE